MCFVGGRSGFDDEFAGVAVDGEVFEFGLRFEGFGVVNMELGAAADGAENVDGNEHVGVGILRRHDFDAAQVEHGLHQVGQEGYVARVGDEGFVTVVAVAVDGEAGGAFAFAAAVFGMRRSGGVQYRSGRGYAGKGIGGSGGGGVVAGVAVLGGRVGVVLIAAADERVDGVAPGRLHSYLD